MNICLGEERERQTEPSRGMEKVAMLGEGEVARLGEGEVARLG